MHHTRCPYARARGGHAELGQQTDPRKVVEPPGRRCGCWVTSPFLFRESFFADSGSGRTMGARTRAAADPATLVSRATRNQTDPPAPPAGRRRHFQWVPPINRSQRDHPKTERARFRLGANAGARAFAANADDDVAAAAGARTDLRGHRQRAASQDQRHRVTLTLFRAHLYPLTRGRSRPAGAAC